MKTEQKRRAILLISLAVLSLLMVAMLASCGEGSKGLRYDLIGREGEESWAVIGIGSCEDEDIVIPSEYRNLPVTEICGPSFSTDGFASGNIKSITIPASVTYIWDGAFVKCSLLERIVIDENNTTYYSEGNCVIEKESKKLIAGCNCSTIPEGVTAIADGAFKGFSKLTNITIPNSVTSIGESAFQNCRGLTSIKIPSSVTNFSTKYAPFVGCDGLKSIEMSFVGLSKFSYLFGSHKAIPESLKTVVITGTSIPDNAFDECRSTNIESITILDGVESIGDLAFYDCSLLKSITIPDSVKSIGKNAFDLISSLQNVYFESPEGWKAGDQVIGSSELSDPANAAQLFSDKDYLSVQWTREP